MPSRPEVRRARRTAQFNLGRGRGQSSSIMREDEYRRRHVLGMYTPTIPPHISNRLRRRRAHARGRCIECALRERVDDRSHCELCLDRKRPLHLQVD